MFSNWKFYLFLLGLIQIIITSIAFFVIKFNDLRHLGKDVTVIKTDIKDLTSKVIKIDKNVAVQKQRINDLEKSTK